MANKTLTELKRFVENRLAIDDISRNTRIREYTEGRAFFFKMAHDLNNITWKEMGKFVGRDHATAIHGVNNVFPLAIKDNKDIDLAYEYFLTHYKKKFVNIGDEFTSEFKELRDQRDAWKAKFEEVYDQLLEEKEWRHRFQKLTGDIPDDKREVVHARMNAIVKML